LGPWSGLTKEEIKRDFPSSVMTWEKEPKELIITKSDGSSFKPIQELLFQASIFLEKIFNEHSPSEENTVLVVAHNAILRCILLKLLNEPQNGFRRIKLDNSSISIVNISPNKNNIKEQKLQIECLNSTAHLSKKIPRKGSNSRVILVRHGETNWNKQGKFQGQIDIPLNETGKKQASAAGSFLKDIPIQKAFSSSMQRPFETAQIILESHNKIKIMRQGDLVEIGHGLWEGKLEAEIASKWPKLLELWKEHPEQAQMPQGENIQEVWDRSISCWEEICKNLEPTETALIVAHDAVNKTILCHLMGLKASDIWMIKQGNGGITVIDISNEEDQPDLITCLNITSHLGSILDKTAAGAL